MKKEIMKTLLRDCVYISQSFIKPANDETKEEKKINEETKGKEEKKANEEIKGGELEYWSDEDTRPKIKAGAKGSVTQQYHKKKAPGRVRQANINAVQINLEEIIKKKSSLITTNPLQCNSCQAFLCTGGIQGLAIEKWICPFCDPHPMKDAPPSIKAEDPSAKPEEKRVKVDPEFIRYALLEEKAEPEEKHVKGDPEKIRCDLPGEKAKPEEKHVKSDPEIIRYDLPGEKARMLEPDRLLLPVKKRNTEKDIRIVFVIDKSGSIGRTDLVGMNNKSPIQVLVERIKEELKKLAKEHPDSKVGIIYFNNNIRILGDCSGELLIKEKEGVKCPAKLKAVTKGKSKELLNIPISKSLDNLLKSLEKIDDTDKGTALGPAVLAGMEMLREGIVGSKMYVFTDGIANIGVGHLEEDEDQKEPPDTKFYIETAKEVREMGIEINFYKISAQNCKIENYLNLTSETNGHLYDVSPENISKEIFPPESKKELALKPKITLALKSKMSLVLPKILKFRLILDKNLLQKENRLEKSYGRLTEQMKETIQFLPNRVTSEEIDFYKEGYLPFQLVIEHTDKDDYKTYLTVLTQYFKIVRQKNPKDDVDVEVIVELMKELVGYGLKTGQVKETSVELDILLETLILLPPDPHLNAVIIQGKEMQKMMAGAKSGEYDKIGILAQNIYPNKEMKKPNP